MAPGDKVLLSATVERESSPGFVWLRIETAGGPVDVRVRVGQVLRVASIGRGPETAHGEPPFDGDGG